MKKIIYVLLISIMTIMFLLSGCDSSSEQTTTTRNPYIGGSDSLSASFEPANPPDEIFAGGEQEFSIVVKLKNTGEYDIPKDKMKVKIQGLQPEAFGKSPSDLEKSPESDLTATKLDFDGNIIQGVEDYISFDNLKYVSDLSTALTDVPIQAKICYAYGTKATANICIKEDVVRDEDGDVCKVSENKKVYSSSAPIGVSSFKETPRGKSSIAFSFKIDKATAGKVYKYDSTCGQGNSLSDENKVWVEVTGVEGIKCTGLSDGNDKAGFVKLSETEGRLITCSLDVAQGTSDYVQPVNIELKYDYEQLLTSQMTIKPNLE